MFNFLVKCLERHEDTNQVTKVKKVSYYISIEKFNSATRWHMVPDDRLLEAYDWAVAFARAATEAPDLESKRAWQRRWDAEKEKRERAREA